MNEKLKNIIFYKLYYDLKQVEMISHHDSIWFIDREQKYWYFIYQKKDNRLWWKHQYFRNYFTYFSLGQDESEYVMSRWVEEVLNSRVDTIGGLRGLQERQVEEVLNSRVDTMQDSTLIDVLQVEEMLNSRVDTIVKVKPYQEGWVEEVLNSTNHE